MSQKHSEESPGDRSNEIAQLRKGIESSVVDLDRIQREKFGHFQTVGRNLFVADGFKSVRSNLASVVLQLRGIEATLSEISNGPVDLLPPRTPGGGILLERKA